MNFLVLGRGKTKSLMAQYTHDRHHHVRVLESEDNRNGKALTPDLLRDVNTVIDFTTPASMLENITACLREKKNMMVETTDWQAHTATIRGEVEKADVGFLHGSNFSISINLFFETIQTTGQTANHGYSKQIFERHHQRKKNTPSDTSLMLQQIIKETSEAELEITSFREKDVVKLHEVIFDSPNDRIYLCHDAKSRHGYAEGTVLGAEWLSGKTGYYEFKDIWREL